MDIQHDRAIARLGQRLLMKKYIFLFLLIPTLAYGGMRIINGAILGGTAQSPPATTTTTTACAAALHSADFSTNDTSQWDSEVDANGEGTAASGAYVVAHNDGDDIYVKETLASNYAEGWCQFTILSDDVTGLGTNWTTNYFFEVYDTASVLQLRLGWSTNGSGNYWQYYLIYNADTGYTTATYLTPPAASTVYTIKVYYKKATAAGANDGQIDVYINGTRQINVTGIDMDTRNGWGQCRLGAPTWGTAGTFNTTVDSWVWRENDCF